jgi:hypothetical protein
VTPSRALHTNETCLAYADSLSSLKQLEALSLSNNRLQTPVLDVRSLSLLTALHLGGNPLSYVPELAPLTRLRTVSLATLRFAVDSEFTTWEAALAPTASLRAAMRARGADIDEALKLLFSRSCAPHLMTCA